MTLFDVFASLRGASSALSGGVQTTSIVSYAVVAIVSALIAAVASLYATKKGSVAPITDVAFGGYSALVTALQADNTLLRTRVSELERHVTVLEKKIDEQTAQIKKLLGESGA